MTFAFRLALPEVPPPAYASQDEIASGLLEAIKRASQVLAAETQALKNNRPLDHKRARRDKDMCLLDLTRRSRNLDNIPPDPDVAAALRDLRTMIIENQSTLRVHLNAAREVVNIVLRTIVEEESDRTYTPTHNLRGGRA